MPDEKKVQDKIQSADSETEARRGFLKRIGSASAAVPALALLLAANSKMALAQSPYSGSSGGSTGGSSTGGSGSGCGSG